MGRVAAAIAAPIPATVARRVLLGVETERTADCFGFLMRRLLLVAGFDECGSA